ncbi:unnamed protein product, partial [Cuscuta europaea]
MPYNRRPLSALRPPTTAAAAEGDEPPLSTSILSLPSDTLSACLCALSSPLLSLFSFSSHSDDSRAVEPGMLSATNSASTLEEDAGGYGGLLLRKIGVGILAAAYVGMILMVLLVLAAVLGVVVVRWWVEEPVLLRERVNFDYTDAHPKATFSFHEHYKGSNFLVKHKTLGVPLGHTFYVSLLLLMPDSDYNRELGIFQVNAELVSNGSGVRTSRSSHPCMLQFRSRPIRLMRELIWGVPLLLGITTETQKLVIPIIRHKETHPRTEAIHLTLMPRSGTQELPHIYGAEIILKSHLPWMKEVLHRWKWTFYMWATLYIYIALLTVSLCCFRPLIIPFLSARHIM